RDCIGWSRALSRRRSGFAVAHAEPHNPHTLRHFFQRPVISTKREVLMRVHRASFSIIGAVVALLLALPSSARADAELPEWFGKWEMNHDGNLGTLLIKNDVTTGNQPWKNWTLLYTYKDGNQVRQVTG